MIPKIPLNLPAIIAIGIIIFVAGIGTGLLPLATPIISGGMVIESIDAVNVIVNNQPNPDGFFLVTATINRGAESFFGTVTPSVFKQMSGVETEGSFDVFVDDIRETANYQVDNKFPNTAFFLTRSIGGSGCTWTGCTGLGLCINQEHDLITADMNFPSISSEIDFIVGVNGANEKVTVSNTQPTTPFSFGSVQWVGGTSTGDFAPNENDFVAIFDTESGMLWKTMHKNNPAKVQYELERSRIISFLDSNCEEVFADTNVIINRINSFNVYYDLYKNANENPIGNGIIEWENRDSVSGDVILNFEVIPHTMNPRVVFKVKASDVGIKVTSGMPEILGVSSPEFASGSLQGQVNVDTINIGSYAGSFSFSLEQCSNFGQSYSITGIQFAPNERRVVTIPIRTLGVATDITEDCTVKVCDSGSGQCDIETVTITQKKAVTCNEGQERVIGMCIESCYGGEWTKKQCCSVFEKVGVDENGNFICEEGEGDSGIQGLLSIIIKILVLFVVSAVISGIVILILAIFVLRTYKIPTTILVILWLGLSLLLTISFSPAIASIAANIVPGVMA